MKLTTRRRNTVSEMTFQRLLLAARNGADSWEASHAEAEVDRFVVTDPELRRTGRKIAASHGDGTVCAVALLARLANATSVTPEDVAVVTTALVKALVR